MLRVAAELKDSPIHGRGLFAAEFIPAGTLVWAFDAGQDQVIPVEEVERADEAARRFLLTYAYYCRCMNGYVLCGDGARFVNHSEQPLMGSHDDSRFSFALRDIQPGEELTEDYRTYDADPLQQWSDLLFDPSAPATEPACERE